MNTAEHDLAALIRDLDFYLTPSADPVLEGFLCRAFAKRSIRAGTPENPGRDAIAVKEACNAIDAEFDA